MGFTDAKKISFMVLLILLVPGFGSAATTSAPPFLAKESFEFESKFKNPLANLFENRSYMGAIYRPNFQNRDTRLLDLYNVAMTPQKIEKGFCENVTKKLLSFGPRVPRKIASVEIFPTNAGEPACDVKVTDKQTGFRERHMLMFVLNNRTYGIMGVFPKGGTTQSADELWTFVKGLH